MLIAVFETSIQIISLPRKHSNVIENMRAPPHSSSSEIVLCPSPSLLTAAQKQIMWTATGLHLFLRQHLWKWRAIVF